MTADTYNDHPARLNDGPGEYWYISDDGDDLGGPYGTLEEARAGADKYLRTLLYQPPSLKLMKVVAVSKTEVAYSTLWSTP